ncbi:hypothetical protein RBB50_012786 [Rhinocladiella similis]
MSVLTQPKTHAPLKGPFEPSEAAMSQAESTVHKSDKDDASRGPRIEAEPYFTSSPFEPTIPPVTSLEDIDLTDPDLYMKGDPHAVWRLLRQQAPVFWHKNGVAPAYKGQNFWCVSTYAGAAQVLGDEDTFSNAEGPFLDVSAETAGITGNIFTSEGDYHRTWRNAVQPYTSPKAMEKSTAAVAACIKAAVEEHINSDVLDAAKLAVMLPPKLVCAFFGLEGDEAAAIERMYQWDPETPGVFEFENETFEKILADRRSNPKNDAYTASNADEDSGRLDHHQAVRYAVAMVQSSFVGLRSAVHNTLVTLVHHPDQFAVLREHPEYIENGFAIEEILRWAGHSMHLARRAVKDTEIMGEKIKSGDVVISLNTSANRDETVFDDPYRLDVSRKRRRIFTFSTGPHQCLGQIPTRRTVKALLQYVVTNFQSLEKIGPIAREWSNTVIASHISTLNIRVTRDHSSEKA